jgi:putative flippase GtrA
VPGTRGEVARFVILGAMNTGFTTAVFYGLSFVVPPSVAFTAVYACALAYLAVATPRFVFRTRLGPGRTAALLTWYACVYLAGLIMIRLLGHIAGLERWAVTLGTVAVTSPMSFFGARVLVGASGGQLGTRR